MWRWDDADGLGEHVACHSFGLATFFILYTCDCAAPSSADQFRRIEILTEKKFHLVELNILKFLLES